MATYKRVYVKTLNNWWKGWTTIPPLLLVILYLVTIGAINITGYSEDMICGGNITCVAEVNFTMNIDSIYLYPNDTWSFSTDRTIRNVKLWVWDERMKTKWREIDLTTPVKGYEYAYKFYKSKGLWRVRFTAEKDEFSTVKWSFGNIDPVWLSTSFESNKTIFKGNSNLGIEVKLLKGYTPNCFSECHLPIGFKYNGTLSTNTRIFDASNIGWALDKLNLNDDIDIKEILWLEEFEYNYSVWIPNVTCKTVTSPEPNSSKYEVCKDNGKYEEKSEIRDRWVKLPASVTLNRNEYYAIDIVGKRKPSIGTFNVDIVPSMMSFSIPELAWWNTSCPTRWPISTKAATAGLPFSVNDSSLFFGNQIWTKNTTGGMWVYNCTTFFAVANETNVLNYEKVSNVSRTGNNPTAVFENVTYHLDELSGTVAYDSSPYSKNGTASSGMTRTSCIYGSCYQFTAASSQSIDTNWAPKITTSDFSMSLWYKSDSTGTYSYLFSDYDADSYGRGISMSEPTGLYFWVGNHVGVNCTQCAEVTADGKWHHIVGVKNSTTIRCFNNGLLNGSANLVTGSTDTGGNMKIGYPVSGGVGKYFNGLIDEVRFFNRALSATEILDMYNNGINNLSSIGAIGYPLTNVFLNYPTDNSWNMSKTVNFSAKFTDTTVSNCSLWTNETSWSLKHSNTSAVANNTNFIITETFGSDGNFLWNVECCNTAGACVMNGTNRTVKIDSTLPTITIANPSNGTVYSTTTQALNVFASETINVWKYQFNGNGTNITFTPNTTFFIGGSDGLKNLTVWANDSAGNINSTVVYFYLCTSPINLYLNEQQIDRYYEYGYNSDIKANSTCGIIHLNISGIGEVNQSGGDVRYTFNTYSKEWRFNDTTMEKNFTSNGNATILLYKYIDLDSSSINVTGLDNSGMPSNISIYVNGTKVKQLVGVINGTRGDILNLSDNSNNVTFILAGAMLKYITVSKNTTITGATMNLTGIQSNLTSNTFSDYSTTKSITFTTTAKNSTFYINVPKDVVINNATLSMTGMPYNDTTNSLVINASEDTYVKNKTAYRDTNYGTSSLMRALYTIGLEHEEDWLFIKFNIPESINRSRVFNVMYAVWSRSGAFSYLDTSWYNTTASWGEGTITWNTGKPTTYTLINRTIPYYCGWNVYYGCDPENFGCYPAPSFAPIWWSTGYFWFYSTYGSSCTDKCPIDMSYMTGGCLNWITRHLTMIRDSTNISFMFNYTYPNNEYYLTLGTREYNYTDDPSGFSYYVPPKMRIYIQKYPSDISIDTIINGTLDYSGNNELNSTVSFVLNVTEMQEYIDHTCITSTCNIPIFINSSNAGRVNLQVNVSYSSTPENVTLDVGSDGHADWSQTGAFTTSVLVNLNNTAIQNFLNSDKCTGFACNIPLLFTSTKSGIINTTDVRVNYSFNPVSLNNSIILNALNNSGAGNFSNVTIGVTATAFGKIFLNGVDIRFKGPQTYNVSAYYNNIINNLNLKVVWSNFSLVMPYTFTTSLIWVAKNATQENITPYGQNYYNPIYNITNLNRDHMANYSIRINSSIDACATLTASNTTNKTGGIVLSSLMKQIFGNLSYANSFGIRLWADINACTGRWINFTIREDACCSDCYPCF